VIIRGKRAQLETKAAWILSEAIRTLLEIRSAVIVAVPGGRSVGGIIRKLVKSDVDWRRVHLFMVDERLVTINHPESNFRLVAESLQGKVPAASLHPFVYDNTIEDNGVGEYDRQLTQLGGRFDIVLVSSGEDGHIASIFPNLQLTGTDGSRFILIEDSPKPPLRRMSASPALIGSAQVGVLLFFGEGKRQALKNFLNPKQSVRNCPAKLISTLPQHYILTDQEVAIP
jgi:6-phosphogluconolactonase